MVLYLIKMSKLDQFEEVRKIFQDSEPSRDEDSSDLLKSIRDKLFSIFCSPMKEEYTHEAFRWVSQLCMSVGDLSWVSSNNKWSHDEAKMFSCITRLSINELHIIIPLIQRHLTYGDEPEIEDGKVLARSAKTDDYNKFGDHLIILESVIKCLVKDQERDDTEVEENSLPCAFTANELGNLLEKLKEAMTSICDYLELVHRHWPELIEQMGSEKFISAEGALRIICIWFSEDPVGFESQSKRFLIDLIIKNLLLSSKQTKHDLLVLALHSICTQDEDKLSTLKQIPDYKEALEKYLDFVQSEQSKQARNIGDRRSQKMFKLRCGLVKDIMIEAGKN